MADYSIANQPLNVHRTRDSLISQRGNPDFMRKIAEMLSFDIVSWDDEFLGDTLDGGYQVASTSGTVMAISAPTSAVRHGEASMITAATNNTAAVASLGLHYYGEHNAIFAALVKVSAVGDVKIEVGFNDNTATENNADANSGAIAAVLATPTATATDGVGWVFDTDDTGNVAWQGFGVANGTVMTKVEPTNIGAWASNADQAAGTSNNAPHAGVYELMIVALSGGSARFYRGGMVGGDSTENDYTKRLQITYDSGWQAYAVTSTVALTPQLFIQARDASARTLTVDRWASWQYRHKSEGVYQAEAET